MQCNCPGTWPGRCPGLPAPGERPSPCNTSVGLLLVALLGAVPAFVATAQTSSPPPASKTLLDPDTLKQALEQRKERQMTALKYCAAFHAFQFTDRWAQSNVRFEHHVVDDAGK